MFIADRQPSAMACVPSAAPTVVWRAGVGELFPDAQRSVRPPGGLGQRGTAGMAGLQRWSAGTCTNTEFSVLPGLQRALAVSCNLYDTDAAGLSESLTEIWRTQ